MLGTYTKSFLNRAAFPAFAAHYATFYCLAASPSQIDMMNQLCWNLCIDSVLESGQVDELVGVLENGARSPGLLDTLMPLMNIPDARQFKCVLLRPAAEKALHQHQEVDRESCGGAGGASENVALLLFNLAGDYDTVVHILSRRTSDALGSVGVESMVEVVMRLTASPRLATSQFPFDACLSDLEACEATGTSVLEFYARHRVRVGIESWRTLSTLLAMAKFFSSVMLVAKDVVESAFSGGRNGDSMVFGDGRGVAWSSALAMVEDIGLIPSSRHPSIPRFSSLASTPSTTVNHFSTPAPQSSTTPYRPHSSAMNTPSTTSSSHHVSEIDYARVAARADQVKQFHELIQRHIPASLLLTELLLLIGWRESIENRKEMCKRSRQILAFAASIGRWFKLSNSIRKHLMEMDEVMM